MFDHEKLDVYRVSLEFAAWCHRSCATMRGIDRFARDQILRASQSIALNIAEGNGRRIGPDRRRFFEIARGSALECAATIDTLVVCNAMTRAESEIAKTLLIRIVEMLTKLAGTGDVVREDSADYSLKEELRE